jgi:hypothetical protein
MSTEIGTLKELSNELATTQEHQVDYVTESAPIMDGMRFEEASHPLWNVYDEVNDVTGGGFVDMDAPLEEIEVSTGLKQVDLKIMSGKMFVPEDKAQAYGGVKKYFAKREGKVLRVLGQNAETSIIYANLRKWCIDRTLDGSYTRAWSIGGSSNKNYTLMAVRWVPGETIGLRSPNAFNGGTLIDVKPLYGGALYENAQGIPGYGLRFKAYIGLQIANPFTVAALVNIDKDSATQKLPTAMQIDDLLAKVRAGDGGVTMLYGHRDMVTVLAQVGKDGALTMTPGDKNVDRRVAEWNGIPFVSSYNFKEGNELNVSLS